MLALLRRRDFALLWTGGLISIAGDWMLIVALPIHVYRLTGSTGATSLAVAMETLPRLLLGSVAGVFVDRWDRRRVIVVANLLLTLTLLVLVLPGATEHVAIVYGVAFTAAMLAQFVSPAEHALLPSLVDVADVLAANALNGLNNNLARLLGPPLGGVIAALWGLRGVGLLDALTFLAAATLVAAIAATPRHRSMRDTAPALVAGAGPWCAAWNEWRDGLGVVRRQATVTVVFGIVAVTSVGEGVFGVLLVVWIARVLDGGAAEYGWLMSAQAAGGLIGGALTAAVARAMPLPWLLGLSAIAIGLVDLLIFNYPRIVPGIVPGLILFVVVGLPASWFFTTQTTLLQQGVSDTYRGRVFGTLGTTGALMNVLGTLLAGLLGNRIGVVAVLNVQAVSYMTAGLAALLALQRLVPRSVRDTTPGF